MIWLVLAYLFHTLGELCLSPMGLSYLSKLIPARMIAFMFGVYYLAVAIGNKLAHYIGGDIDKITEDKKKSAELDHGNKLAGDVTQEFKLEKDFMNNIGFLKFIGINISQWIQISLKQKITKFSLIDSWIVRQFKNEYNPSHWHNGHVSGVGYLKVPSNLGETLQKDKKVNNNGKLEMVHGSKAFLCKPTFRVTPKVGDFYFFPHYLMHAVYPFFDSDEERRSVSFNATVDQSLFNE